jgi:hypothetical protein
MMFETTVKTIIAGKLNRNHDLDRKTGLRDLGLCQELEKPKFNFGLSQRDHVA